MNAKHVQFLLQHSPIISFIICLLFVVISKNVVYAQISGNVSGVWSFENSPYCITGNIEVESGESLYIEAGVQVIFYGPYQLDVRGNLQAVGYAEKPIGFSPVDKNEGWRGIHFWKEATDTNRLIHCRIAYAKTGNDNISGGGIFSECQYFVMKGCIIEHCYSGAHGGGLQLAYKQQDGLNLIQNSFFFDNTAEDDGGGLASLPSYNTYVINSVFARNEALDSGGAVAGGGIRFHGYGQPYLINCVITENYAGTNGSGLSCYWNVDPIIRNCIIYNNTPTSNLWSNSSANPTVNNCIIGEAWTGIGSDNIIENPLFVNPADNNFSLQSNSPCIDKGLVDETVYALKDMIGFLRPLGMPGDIGAYEYGLPFIQLLSQNNSCSETCDGSINALALSAPDEGYTIQWNNGSTTEDLTDLCPDVYLVTMFDTDGIPIAENIIELTYQLPSPLVSFESNEEKMCLEDNLFSFDQNISIACNENYTFEWDFGDDTQTDIENPEYSFLTSDTFDIKLNVTANNGCTSSFTKQIIVEECNNLSIELLDFDGEILENGNHLFWTTASEKDNKGFWLQRSFDGTHFTNIDFMEGAGTKNQIQNYSYIDPNTTKGLFYYRLLQTDYNGTISYSYVITLQRKGIEQTTLSIHQISVDKNIVNIHTYTDNEFTLNMYDLNGKQIYTQTLYLNKGHQTFHLPVVSAKGMYLLQLVNEQENLVHKFEVY